MPAKDPSLTIQQAADQLAVTPDTLRFYEKQGLLLRSCRTASGHRRYQSNDMEWLRFILCLKSTGMSLDIIRQYRDLLLQGEHTTEQRQHILVQHQQDIRQQLTTLRTNLKRIDQKIAYYDALSRGESIDCGS
ncbi:MerR family transcriptional regulator [Neiella marina]|uniref:MerR family transcriptional regulator n=1 Tax=Neiella marina TaxID=508461 RepID=A0A8J2U364_9GAMM|nr:MerR family transcriptional regulator [Neiella marina]GGA69082.1 MerR family transcriptional regulator [Neiella marina]